MPSKKTALDSFADMPTVQPKKRKSWDESLKDVNPDRYQQLLDVCTDFAEGGIVKVKMKTQSALRKYLAGEDRDRPIDPPLIPDIGIGSFNNFMIKVYRGEA